MTHFRLKNPGLEKRLFQNRITAAAVVIVLMTLGLIGRLIYLQIIGHEHYAMKARDNRVKIAPLPPTRGLIFDRSGVVLAENISVYSLEIVPEQVKNLEKTILRLKAILPISDEEIQRFKVQIKRHKPFESIPLKLRLTDEEVSRFAVKRPFFRGVDIRARLIRHYPFRELVSHVVGYVASISEAELKKLDPAEYRGTSHIGKTGIEKFYEKWLHGETGYAEIETNARGRELTVLKEVPSRPGKDLHLSLDIRLQAIAYEALGEHNGAVVALEPASGKILAMVSKPGYDPNDFVLGISQKKYRSLQRSPERPLFDRSIRGTYPPGSTIKPFMGLAGLNYGVIDAHRKLHCPGYYQLPNNRHRYRDWKKWGHGPVDLHNAIAQSCDVYFYELAHQLEIDRIHDFLARFGFGAKTKVDLVGEKPGLLPSRAWKKKRFHQVWFPGETVIAGIGQGFLQVTPIQLAKAAAIMGNQGMVITPRVAVLEKPKDNQLPPVLDIPKSYWRTIIDAMVAVVHGPRGTARRLGKGINYHIAGKTGTAQVFTVKQDEEYREKEVKKKLRDHALFIAFAPAEAPRIAVAVVAENAGHGGSAAAPIARQMMDAYFSFQP
ncbi:MAG: penicillin-binding protein 2 [Methylothermaceae bacteria B42]|nr:MAG: penicillin-binding protein 2 [Methylothermaceae bacteria B42]HHJ38832.1 penicillin-binding protein 2 [Methylothermaceae bacterium]